MPQASTLVDVDDVYTRAVDLTAILLQLHKQEMSFDFGKLFGRGDPSKKTDAVLQYNERRFHQMATFYGCTIAAYIASKIAYRGVIKRRYNPNFYQHNHVPPKFNFYKDAMAAVTHSTLLATSMMAMIGSGAFWYCDISTIKEFTSRMKVFLGGDEAERALKAMPEDEETKQITDSLDSLLNGNLLDAFGEEEEEEGVKVTKK
jgi:hypothetical protein